MSSTSKNNDDAFDTYRLMPAEKSVEYDYEVHKPRWFREILGWFLLGLIILFGLAFIILAVFQFGLEYGEKNSQRLLYVGQENKPFWNSESVVSEEAVFRGWAVSAKRGHAIEKKIDSVSIAIDLIGNPSDHVFLGAFEQGKTKRTIDSGVHYYMAMSNGHPDATRMQKSLNLPAPAQSQVYQLFLDLHELNGDRGLFRMGQYFLGKHVFKIADAMGEETYFNPPNQFSGNKSEQDAYKYFHMAALCEVSKAFDWRAETAKYFSFTKDQKSALEDQAYRELRTIADKYVKRTPGGRIAIDEYCSRQHLDGVKEKLMKHYAQREAIRYLDQLDVDPDENIDPCGDSGHSFTPEQCQAFEAFGLNGRGKVPHGVPSIEELIKLIIDGVPDAPLPPNGGGNGGGYGGGYGSQLYRNSPGGQAYDNIEEAANDGLPEQCLRQPNPGECAERVQVLECESEAREHFNRGESDMAAGNVDYAIRRFERAIEEGRACQSSYAALAAKRLSLLYLTCEYTEGSLARISRDYQNNPEGGALIDLRTRQQALKAKGYYRGFPDGKYGPGTREAVRDFQREMGTRETGDLTPIETVYLLCSAAETHEDLKSINTLGIMYIAGLGVVQNTDRGMQLLINAAERGNTDSMFNLALIYGTGTVFSSYQLCGNVENIERADYWLEEAANAGSEPAQRYIGVHGPKSPTKRWTDIKDDLSKNTFYQDRLELVGEACRPN